MTRRLGSGSLVIATHNEGKLREISALLAPYGLQCISAGSLGLPEPAETGTTFVENALIKARAAADASGIVALADDSGLSVDALGDRPGVYTADWAERQWFEGEAGRDWYMAMGKVEGMLQQLGPDTDRSAAFHCVLALAWPDGDSAVYEGKCSGSLTWPPRGDLGFGYDPLAKRNTANIARRPIATDQKFIHPVFGNGAADFFRLWPNQLGVMPNIGPIARLGDIGEDTRSEIGFLADKGINHLLRSITPARSYPQVFARAFAHFLASVLHHIPLGEVIGPILRVHRQLRIPCQSWSTKYRAFRIVLLKQFLFCISES